MSQNSESSCQKRENIFKTESLPFSEIPHQSCLFIDYQQHPALLENFYPQTAKSFNQIPPKAKEVLANYKTDRAALCDALEIDNKSYGAGEKTLRNIDRLREEDCVTVVTGQQAGLFSGAIYTIYKALSAVKTAEYLSGQGIKAVPVFWIAEEDHDFEEVKRTSVLNFEGKLKNVENTPQSYLEGLPVGAVKLDAAITQTIEELLESLPETEFSGELASLLRESYKSGETFSNGFAVLLTKIFAAYGLIIFSPLNPVFKKLAAPIFTEAMVKSETIRERLLVRNEELKTEDYHAQVLVEEDFFPFFLFDESGQRQSIKFKIQNLKSRIKDPRSQTNETEIQNPKSKIQNREPLIFRSKDGREFGLEDLIEIAENSPEKLSPNALMRPIVQDYLLPTVCYYGGGAEIAYFAQNSVIYEILERPLTTILHRQSLTVVESKHRRTLEKYALRLPDLFAGFESVLPMIVEKYLNPETTKVFAEAEEIINLQLNRLDQSLSEIEPTLAENLTNRRRKILYHIGALQHKFHLAQLRRDETINRQIETAFASLWPHNALQERTLNVVTFLNRYGYYFIDWIYDAIDLEDRGHRVIYL